MAHVRRDAFANHARQSMNVYVLPGVNVRTRVHARGRIVVNDADVHSGAEGQCS